MNRINKVLFFVCGIAIFLYSCKAERIAPNKESQKDLTGSWGIIKVVQNSNEITETYDFSKFKLVFNGSNYTLENKIPFIVSENGTYSLDDNQYAFTLTLNPAGGTTEDVPFNYPIADGKRALSISFTGKGCALNKYVFTFNKLD